MPMDLIHGKSTLIQVMTGCHQAKNHYLHTTLLTQIYVAMSLGHNEWNISKSTIKFSTPSRANISNGNLLTPLDLSNMLYMCNEFEDHNDYVIEVIVNENIWILVLFRFNIFRWDFTHSVLYIVWWVLLILRQHRPCFSVAFHGSTCVESVLFNSIVLGSVGSR